MRKASAGIVFYAFQAEGDDTPNLGTHLDSAEGTAVETLFLATVFNSFGDSQAVKPCDHHIKETIQLAERMIKLADRGDIDREDTGCGILYGMLRDAGYKIKQLAEAEKLKHQAKGWWDERC